jgi:hypothetical protein
MFTANDVSPTYEISTSTVGPGIVRYSEVIVVLNYLSVRETCNCANSPCSE